MADQFHFVTQSSKLGNERETRDRVLDALTIKALNKLINTDNVIGSVEGCLSSGKEANVYHCLAPTDGRDGARKRPIVVKVYATTVNIFKSRQVYMQGWHNMNGVRSGREMIAQWATNEFNHLKRLHKAGIPCPEPIEHRDNVVVMSLLGSEDGAAYPRLQTTNLIATTNGDTGEQQQGKGEASVSEKWAQLYSQLLGYMRRMFKISRLVHGDLSEYNILYGDGKLHIIDVSQSLEHDHPECLSMLRMDIGNITTFFRRKKVDVLPEQTVFEFITTDDAPLDEEGMYKTIEELYASRATATTEEDRAREEVEENEFRNKFIPRTLGEAYDLEAQGVPADRTAIAHLLADGKGEEEGEGKEEDDRSDDDDDKDGSGSDSGVPIHSGDEGEDSSFSFESKTKRPRGKKHIDKAEKQMHKMAVKEAKREQRATKMPKKEKASLIAKTAKRKTKKR